jgi:uncharacterized protein (UPF0303 family)
MNHSELLQELEAEHATLRFKRFGFEEAWSIGQDLVARALGDGLAVTIDITIGQQQVFHCAMPGTSPDNDHWVQRKNRVTNRFHRSSLYVATQLRLKGKTIEEVWGLSSFDFAPYGGAVPVQVEGAGVIGTITVSGLPDQEDHRMVADAIRRQLRQPSPKAKGVLP